MSTRPPLTALDLNGIALGGSDEDLVFEQDGDLRRGGHFV